MSTYGIVHHVEFSSAWLVLLALVAAPLLLRPPTPLHVVLLVVIWLAIGAALLRRYRSRDDRDRPPRDAI